MGLVGVDVWLAGLTLGRCVAIADEAAGVACEDIVAVVAGASSSGVKSSASSECAASLRGMRNFPLHSGQRPRLPA